MSYGVYSEVYFAINFDDKTFIKIGETTNARRRANQLYKEGYYIIKSIDIEGTEAERLFVESYLRAKIASNNNVQQYRKDYFKCESKEMVQMFEDSFDYFVEQALEILKNFQNNFKKGLDNKTFFCYI